MSIAPASAALSAVRSDDETAIILMADGSVRVVSAKGEIGGLEGTRRHQRRHPAPGRFLISDVSLAACGLRFTTVETASGKRKPIMNHRKRSAFSLFQMLILLAFLAILLALLLPAVAKVREAAARSSSMNNMKQIAIASLPVTTAERADRAFPPGNDKNNYSAATYILPYIEQQNVWFSVDRLPKKPMDDKANAEVRKTIIRTYLSPRDGVPMVSADFGATNYLFNAGSETVAGGERWRLLSGLQAQDNRDHRWHQQHLAVHRDAQGR